MWVLLCIFVWPFDEGETDARAVLAAMGRTYRSLQSYHDKGKVEIKGSESLKVTFLIKYESPNKLRVEWVAPGSFEGARVLVRRGAVVTDGTQTLWYDSRRDNQESDQSLSSAIELSTGDSFGSSQTIPSLLMKDIGGFNLLDLVDAKIDSQVTVDDKNIYVIQGKHADGITPYVLWIGVDDHLLYRVEHSLAVETHEYIVINQAIDPDSFQPQGAKSKN